MSEPNFLLIGAQKCGTTWLARMLDSHPDVFTATPKELHFFNQRSSYDRGLDTYRQNFAGVNDESAIGECTPNYLWVCPNEREIEERGVIADIAPLVHAEFPDVKLIVALRDPVERARSAYYHFAKSGAFRPGRSILDVGDENGIITMGDYLPQIERWLEFFDREQFLFLVYEEDIAANKPATLRRVFDFLDVDPSFEGSNLSQQFNVRSGHLYMRLHYIAPRVTDRLVRFAPSIKTSNLGKIEIPSSDLSHLAERYRSVNAGLDQVIGRSLPW